MTKLTRMIVAIVSIAFLFSSCTRYVSERSLDRIALNMPKAEVMHRMKNTGVARGAILNRYGQSIEIREYKVEKPKSGSQLGAELALTACTFGLFAPILLSNGEIDTYWLYFYNGRLVRWGQAGDWDEAERKIYDINFTVDYSVALFD